MALLPERRYTKSWKKFGLYIELQNWIYFNGLTVDGEKNMIHNICPCIELLTSKLFFAKYIDMGSILNPEINMVNLIRLQKLNHTQFKDIYLKAEEVRLFQNPFKADLASCPDELQMTSWDTNSKKNWWVFAQERLSKGQNFCIKVPFNISVFGTTYICDKKNVQEQSMWITIIEQTCPMIISGHYVGDIKSKARNVCYSGIQEKILPSIQFFVCFYSMC